MIFSSGLRFDVCLSSEDELLCFRNTYVSFPVIEFSNYDEKAKVSCFLFPVSLVFTDEIDKQKRELLSARQAKEAAEHQCTTEVFNGKVVFCLVLFPALACKVVQYLNQINI